MSVLVCGSLAYDTVMVCDDKFKLQYSAGEPLEEGEGLEFYYTVPDMRRSFGGCAGNIAYNLKLLDKEAEPMAVVGHDFTAYANWLDSKKISRKRVMEVEHSYTAQTFITQDMDDSRIVTFHPGAMNFSHMNRIPEDGLFQLGVIGSDGIEGMHSHAHQMAEKLIPYIFYPGHSLHQLTGDDVLSFMQLAQWMILSRKEAKKIQQLTGLTLEQLAERVDALVVNNGRQGADIYTAEAKYQTPCPKPSHIYDYSGCEDAFCAGMVYSLLGDLDWETAGRIASLLWVVAIQHHGTQSHIFKMEKFKNLFQQAFGYALLA